MAAAAASPGSPNILHCPPNLPCSFAEIVSGNLNIEVPSSPRAASKSFSSIFEKGGSFSIKSPGLFKGEPAILFSKEEIEKLSSPFRFTLIGKFSHWRPSMEIIRKFFNSLGLKSHKSVGLIHENHVVIFISDQEDYSRLLFRSTWYVNGAPMKISNWSPDFLPYSDSPVVPVWVGFPGLPLHFFEKSVLFSIASVFGSPLKTDEPTALLTRPSVARVCIDLDVSKPRGNRVWLGDEKVGFWQEVVFENPPLFCSFCQKLGHDINACFVKNPELKKEKIPPTTVLEKKKFQHLEKNGDIEPLTWKKKSVPSNLENIYEESKISKEVKVVNTEEEGGGWLIQKSKRNKKDRKVVDTKEIPALKENPSLGVALTPLNPLFLAKLSKSKVPQINSTLESSSPMNLQSEGKTSVSFPAQALEKEIDTNVAISHLQPPPLSQPLDHGRQQSPLLPLTNDVPSGSTKAAGSPSFSVVLHKSGNKNACKNQSAPVIQLKSNDINSVKLANQCLEGTSCLKLVPRNVETKILKRVAIELLISTSVIEIQPLIGKELQFQPQLSMESGPHASNHDENTYTHGLQIQPSNSLTHRTHEQICEKKDLQFQLHFSIESEAPLIRTSVSSSHFSNFDCDIGLNVQNFNQAFNDVFEELEFETEVNEEFSQLPEGSDVDYYFKKSKKGKKCRNLRGRFNSC